MERFSLFQVDRRRKWLGRYGREDRGAGAEAPARSDGMPFWQGGWKIAWLGGWRRQSAAGASDAGAGAQVEAQEAAVKIGWTPLAFVGECEFMMTGFWRLFPGCG